MPFCKVGAVTGETCGTVKGIDGDVVEASVFSLNGDSGSPGFVKNPDGTVSAVGLLMSSPDGDDYTTYFTLVSAAARQVGLARSALTGDRRERPRPKRLSFAEVGSGYRRSRVMCGTGIGGVGPQVLTEATAKVASTSNTKEWSGETWDRARRSRRGHGGRGVRRLFQQQVQYGRVELGAGAGRPAGHRRRSEPERDGPGHLQLGNGVITIGIGDATAGVGAVISNDNPPIVHSVGLGNVNGVALGFSDAAPNQGSNAGAAVNGKSYAIKGTATGTDMSNPQQPQTVTKPFELDVTCP